MRYASVLIIFTLLMSSVTADADEAVNPRPPIVPSPMLAVMGSGYVPVTASSKITVSDEQLRTLAQVFAEEIETVTGLQLEIVGRREPAAGDIAMQLANRGNEEAYMVTVKDATTLKATNYQGMAHATTTVIQSLTKQENGWALPRMSIGDEPGKSYRGVLIDVARRWNSPRALRHVIQMARYYKIRYMVLHLTDDHAWTFPSTKFPKLGSKNTGFRGPAPRVYTKQELLDLVKFADERGVTLVPEIESPGHSGQMRSTYPEEFGFYEKDVEQPLWVVDIANPRAYEGLEILIGEACDIFKSSPYFHIGNDEAAVSSAERDTEHFKQFKEQAGVDGMHQLFVHFTTKLNEYVKANGKRTIIWGDGPKSHDKHNPPEDIIRMVWIDKGWANVYLQKKPYEVISASWEPLYQVNQTWERLENNLKAKSQDEVPLRGNGPMYDFYIPESVYNWNPYSFGGHQQQIHLPSSQMIGAQLTVWEQGGEVQFAGLRLPMAAYAEKAWNIGSSQTYQQFEQRMREADKRLGVLMVPLDPFEVGEIDTPGE